MEKDVWYSKCLSLPSPWFTNACAHWLVTISPYHDIHKMKHQERKEVLPVTHCRNDQHDTSTHQRHHWKFLFVRWEPLKTKEQRNQVGVLVIHSHSLRHPLSHHLTHSLTHPHTPPLTIPKHSPSRTFYRPPFDQPTLSHRRRQWRGRSS